MRIRPATVDDAQACTDIYSPFVTESWVTFELEAPSRDEVAERITLCLASHAWLVAECQGEVVGYAYGSPHRARGAYATSCDVSIFVTPDRARLGIGRALYEILLPALSARGYHAAFAGISLPNPGSIGLHEAMGFTPVGVYREVGWKMGGWRDVGWWQRLL